MYVFSHCPFLKDAVGVCYWESALAWNDRSGELEGRFGAMEERKWSGILTYQQQSIVHTPTPARTSTFNDAFCTTYWHLQTPFISNSRAGQYSNPVDEQMQDRLLREKTSDLSHYLRTSSVGTLITKEYLLRSEQSAIKEQNWREYKGCNDEVAEWRHVPDDWEAS